MSDNFYQSLALQDRILKTIRKELKTAFLAFVALHVAAIIMMVGLFLVLL
jgi:hypothetical protein